MDIYLDTANLNEIKVARSWGVIDGVTTNPSLIKREVERLKAAGGQVNISEHIREILAAAGEEHPVSLEVTATTAQDMVTQGKKLHALFNNVANNVVIKIPVNPDMGQGNSSDGLKAIKVLEAAEIPTNATLVMTPEQALLAAKAGATYVSPFAGRIDDFLRDGVEMEYQKGDYFPCDGEDTDEDEEDMEDHGIVSGVDLVVKIVDMFEKQEMDCNVLAASIRNPRQVREIALTGCDVATVGFSVLKRMLIHIKTTEGMKKFTADIVPEYQAVFGGSAPAQPTSQPAQPERPQQPERPAPQPERPPAPQQPERPQSTPSAHDLVR